MSKCVHTLRQEDVFIINSPAHCILATRFLAVIVANTRFFLLTGTWQVNKPEELSHNKTVNVRTMKLMIVILIQEPIRAWKEVIAVLELTLSKTRWSLFLV